MGRRPRGPGPARPEPPARGAAPTPARNGVAARRRAGRGAGRRPGEPSPALRGARPGAAVRRRRVGAGARRHRGAGRPRRRPARRRARRRASSRTAAAAGVDLLPGAGELQPRCSCPDWADPCKHAAAVCYLVADQLDADPFALFLLRGRDREQVMAGVRHQRAGAVPLAADLASSSHLARPVDAGVAGPGRLRSELGSVPRCPSSAGHPMGSPT